MALKFARLIGIALLITQVSSAWAGSEVAFVGGRGVGIGTPFSRDNANPAKLNIANPTPPPYSNLSPTLMELKRAGFDFVRLAFDPTPLLAGHDDNAGEVLGVLKAAMDQVVRAQLALIVDMHVPEGGPWRATRFREGKGTAEFDRYLWAVRQVASLVNRYDPSQVALEVFNEPPPPCVWSADQPWPDMLSAIASEARSMAPRHTLVLSGACFTAINGLTKLDARSFDQNTLFTFHYYQPYIFTHQGFWSANAIVRALARLPWPSSLTDVATAQQAAMQRMSADKAIADAERAATVERIQKEIQQYKKRNYDREFHEKNFATVTAWAKRNQVAPERILLGEFGVIRDIYGYTTAAEEARLNWLRDVRASAEQSGFRWSVWSLLGPMGIVRGENSGVLDRSILDALGLRGGK